MFKIEVGNGPLMFMSYSRIINEILKGAQEEEVKNTYYAILYDFGMPIGCGKMIVENNLYVIDNLNILEEFYTSDLIKNISAQLLKKAKTIGLKEKK